MLSRREFVRQSLETHLFFARIMKEHAYLLLVGFMPKDNKCIEQAWVFNKAFDDLLIEVIELGNGVISTDVIQSGELVTKYTFEAEKLTEEKTGEKINRKITELEHGICAGSEFRPSLEQRVYQINRKSIKLIEDFICFQQNALQEVLCCRLFSMNYASTIEHFIKEARLYCILLRRYQGRDEVHFHRSVLEQQVFWNDIMEGHALIFKGMFDHCEEERIRISNHFAKEFERLLCETKEMKEMHKCDIHSIIEDNLKATKGICEFKAETTDGMIDCNVRSIMMPLFLDHTLREASHYIRLLSIFKYVE